MDFSHLVDEGSLGMGSEDGSDNSNTDNNNEHEKGQKEVKPVKPPPLDFISKGTHGRWLFTVVWFFNKS